MAEIEVTIRAEERDLREFSSAPWFLESNQRVADAIAAALPKPRIKVKPGMVLRRRGSDVRWMAFGHLGMRPELFSCDFDSVERHDEVNPDFWEVILDVD